jgi:hypothetical protein
MLPYPPATAARRVPSVDEVTAIQASAGWAQRSRWRRVRATSTSLGWPRRPKDEDHEVFAKGAMNQQIHLGRLFTQTLTVSQWFSIPRATPKASTGGVVFRLREHREPRAPCLSVPVLPD